MFIIHKRGGMVPLGVQAITILTKTVSTIATTIMIQNNIV